MKLLLVEDEPALAATVSEFLRMEGHICEAVTTFRAASEKIEFYDYDCLLLDITLPDGDGLGLIGLIKKLHPSAGIIITSAKNSIDEKISGLNLGADDYLPKPFHLAELNARINSVVRRRQFDGKQELIFNEIRVLPEARKMFVMEREVALTKKEFELLLFFIANKNKVLRKESIAEHLWGDMMDMADNYDFIYSHIKNLRRKLIEAGASDYVQTLYGTGYKFNE